ncbi:MAG: Type II secretion system F domain-containing protein, type IV pilus assembly protein PilC [Berkelbacteria bacterium GW2011_GWE1_39_12]|uniref:Type II secretion system F domain-containing protein, type IV pilus assembly protein PilC n=1 Tax=Berkelbacteria bacterium GW2011_GWE1_39_12 TaxID=1618337 RepID=A0A0G4B5Q9_9BACT|nr:MAG: Type II secretion system F domain-containing protein, type IV pilus assembly protein PilC [Berkelbacteria bacterium GW2011_GWE1_39_12]
MLFEYTAAGQDGTIRKSQMEATDKDAVISYLKRKDFLVIRVAEKAEDIGQVFAGKVTALEKIDLTGNLSIMLKAGVGMPEALEIISKDSKNPYFEKVCSSLKSNLENGRPLSVGLKHYPKDFSNVFISLIKAGEASGKLEQVLAQLSQQLKKEHSLVTKIRSAFAYPVVLVCGLIAVVILLMTFVLPKLVTLFSDSNLKLPLGTRIVFDISQALSARPIFTLIGVILLTIIILFLARNQKIKAFSLRTVYHLPVASQLIAQMELARFSRTLSSLMQSGVPIVQALEITAEALSLPQYKKMVLDAKEDIAKGVSLTNAFKKNEKIFPQMLVSVMQVGEKTGNLDKLLLSIGDYFEEQVDNTLSVLTSLVEPVLLVVVGVAIGGMAISIILPIYQLIGSF